MKSTLTILIIIFSGCSQATEKNHDLESEICDIYFQITKPCKYKKLVADLVVEDIASDEKSLKKLNIDYKGEKYKLIISDDVSMLKGDKGYISFEDINFDGVADIALTTSFGLANLYLDYWVYNTDLNKYIYIGNHAKFDINYKNHSLSNTVKVSAAKYDKKTYIWKDFNLIAK